MILIIFLIVVIVVLTITVLALVLKVDELKENIKWLKRERDTATRDRDTYKDKWYDALEEIGMRLQKNEETESHLSWFVKTWHENPESLSRVMKEAQTVACDEIEGIKAGEKAA